MMGDVQIKGVGRSSLEGRFAVILSALLARGKRNGLTGWVALVDGCSRRGEREA